jgi:hypothetical protein
MNIGRQWIGISDDKFSQVFYSQVQVSNDSLMKGSRI